MSQNPRKTRTEHLKHCLKLTVNFIKASPKTNIIIVCSYDYVMSVN